MRGSNRRPWGCRTPPLPHWATAAPSMPLAYSRAARCHYKLGLHNTIFYMVSITHFRVDILLSSFTELIVRAEPGPVPRDAAIASRGRFRIHWAPLSSLSLWMDLHLSINLLPGRQACINYTELKNVYSAIWSRFKECPTQMNTNHVHIPLLWHSSMHIVVVSLSPVSRPRSKI